MNRTPNAYGNILSYAVTRELIFDTKKEAFEKVAELVQAGQWTGGCEISVLNTQGRWYGQLVIPARYLGY